MKYRGKNYRSEKEKVEKIKYVYDNNYSVREITKPNLKIPQINVISSNEYTVVMNAKGEGYSKYKNCLLYTSPSPRDRG